MKYPQVKNKSVLITGCSSGIGLATAELLKTNGWNVIPTARKTTDLDMLRAKGFEPIQCDVANPESVETAAQHTLKMFDGTIGALINNAGIAQMGAVEDLSREALTRQFEVNFFGAHDLTTRFLPVFRNQGWGRIVNVSSVYGRVVAPMVGAYCASKYAMEALSDAMRIELRACGIAVSLIEPGPIITEFRNNAARHSLENLDVEKGRFGKKYQRKLNHVQKKAPKQDYFSKPPEAVAKKILHALESNRPHIRYCVTIPAHLSAVLRRILPSSWMDAILAKSART